MQLEECTTLFAPLSDNRPVWPLHHLVHCAKVKDECWLKYVSSLLQQGVSLENEVITWASYHSQLIGVESVKPRAEIGMFPMMRHGMELTKTETGFHNPGQNAGLGADQPMYAIVNQLQWQFPYIFRGRQVCGGAGAFQIEDKFHQVAGNVLRDLGWTQVLVQVQTDIVDSNFKEWADIVCLQSSAHIWACPVCS